MAGRAPDERYVRDVRFSPFGSAHESLTSRISAGRLSCITTTPHFSVSAPLTISVHHIPTSYFLNDVTCLWRSILGGLLLYEQCIPGYYGLMSEYDGWISPTLV